MNGDPTITIMGNLCSTPEIRYTQSGVAVAQMTIAHTPTVWRENAWEKGTPLFLRAEVWRDQAEHLATSLDKGDRVVATGLLRQEVWEDKQSGAPRSAFKLVISEIGASLRWADVSVRKVKRTGPAPVDPQTGEAAIEAHTPKGGDQ